MKDVLRSEWLKKLQTLESQREIVVDASSKRRHKPYVVNTTMRPIIITGLGPDLSDGNGGRIKAVLTIGVMGEDDYGAGIKDIREYTDDELDNCTAYQSLLANGHLKEITEDECKIQLQKIAAYRDKIKKDIAFRKQLAVQQAMMGMQAQGIQGYYDPSIRGWTTMSPGGSSIETFEVLSGGIQRVGGGGGFGLEDGRIPGINFNTNYESASEYFRDIYGQ